MTDIPRRRAMTAARKRRIWTLYGGLCDECGEPVALSGGTIYDHRIPFWTAPYLDDDGPNVRPIHVACDKQKTKADQGVIGHIKRLIARQDGTRRPRKAIPQRVDPWPKGRTIPSRPFSKKQRGFSK